MSDVLVRIEFTTIADDDEFVLDQLTEELADDLRDIGEVRRLERPVTDPDAKGAGELVLGTVTVLAGADPGYVQALVDVVLAFLQRNAGRRVHLRVGDIELTIDRATRAQTDELIRTVQAAIDKAGN
ncbi:hypothetical protein ABGB16_15265 [Micromonospora sp. B11E3]|uniref:effector-associated constant component EACC1 n=1 Tax=Micromonospora sp. B11E3 TaxID=3153562 RepID=UPI00325D1616